MKSLSICRALINQMAMLVSNNKVLLFYLSFALENLNQKILNNFLIFKDPNTNLATLKT